ncbi:MAG: ATP synthase subunit delta [Alphaproteobacteria bacterium MarineAlpha9_Bin2]|nr:MAG: ATP synthase subunit delta [Alphaproteobacteria bacterium MarineAlpha9_Bin2]
MANNSKNINGIVERYSKALMELSQEQKCIDVTHEEIEQIKLMIDKSEDFRKIIESPLLSRHEQKVLVASILKKAAMSTLLTNFLTVVCMNKRSYLIGRICDRFREMYSSDKGILAAELVSAIELSEADLRLVEKQIQESAGSKVNLNTKIDPSILGGYVLRIGSLMLDGSIRSRLEDLKVSMREG